MAARNAISGGETFLVKVKSDIYLVNVTNQRCRPDEVRYKWRKLDDNEEHVAAGSIITLPAVKIQWTCAVAGIGHIYAAPFFLQEPPEYQIGIPFIQKPLNTITPADIEKVKYTSYPWEIGSNVQQYSYDYDSAGNRTNEQAGSTVATTVPNNLVINYV